MTNEISKSIRYIGVDDDTLDLFESQYVVPEGMTYNSYLIDDTQIAIFDTVDARKLDEWTARLEQALDGRQPDYLIVQHLEPDHSAGIKATLEKYPNLKLVASQRAISMLPQFFEGYDFSQRTIAVKEGDTLAVGSHVLRFIAAPMIHWPEVIMTYEETEKVFFSADAFGKFGALKHETDDWACEARRYYFNIVGKYGGPVQTLLKKVAPLDIEAIAPLHGPVLRDNLGYYLGIYDTWSSYRPETDGVLVAYASIHGGTAEAARKLAEMLEAKGCKKVAVADLSRDDMAEAVEDAFRMSRMVLAAATYDGGIFTPMAHFLHVLKAKTYQSRRVGIIENGSWAPVAGKQMKTALEDMKNVEVVEPTVTIKSRMHESDIAALEALADAMMA